MSCWGIAETAPVIEKIKAESADYLGGLNSCGEITWNIYDEAFDFYTELILRAYEQGKKDAQPEIIRCKDCKHYDGRPCGIVDWYNTADDFCSRAERRTDDSNK